MVIHLQYSVNVLPCQLILDYFSLKYLQCNKFGLILGKVFDVWKWAVSISVSACLTAVGLIVTAVIWKKNNDKGNIQVFKYYLCMLSHVSFNSNNCLRDLITWHYFLPSRFYMVQKLNCNEIN